LKNARSDGSRASATMTRRLVAAAYITASASVPLEQVGDGNRRRPSRTNCDRTGVAQQLQQQLVVGANRLLKGGRF
jgi:hypothetical protein